MWGQTKLLDYYYSLSYNVDRLDAAATRKDIVRFGVNTRETELAGGTLWCLLSNHCPDDDDDDE